MSRVTRIEFSKQFQTHFKIHLRPEWIDAILTLYDPRKNLHFNVISFDKYLHEQFGEYEDAGKSMAAIIEEKFGAPARRLIEDHL